MSTISIGDWAKKAGLSLDQAARGIKISLFTAIILDTRVDTGRLRGNWQTSTGEPVSSVIERISRKKQGQRGGASYQEVIKKVTSDGVDYMTNNLPYAAVYEEKDGMIAKNMQRIERIVREVTSV